MTTPVFPMRTLVEWEGGTYWVLSSHLVDDERWYIISDKSREEFEVRDCEIRRLSKGRPLV